MMMRLMLLLVYTLAPMIHCGLLMNALSAKCQALQCPAPPGGCQVDASKDGHGCPVTCDYTCGAPWCRLRQCNLICNHGYIEDAIGCNACRCHNYCSETDCQSYCPSGYLTDSNNCPTCICKPYTHGCNILSRCDRGFCPDSCRCQPDCFDAYPLPDNPVILAL